MRVHRNRCVREEKTNKARLGRPASGSLASGAELKKLPHSLAPWELAGKVI